MVYPPKLIKHLTKPNNTKNNFSSIPTMHTLYMINVYYKQHKFMVIGNSDIDNHVKIKPYEWEPFFVDRRSTKILRRYWQPITNMIGSFVFETNPPITLEKGQILCGFILKMDTKERVLVVVYKDSGTDIGLAAICGRIKPDNNVVRMLTAVGVDILYMDQKYRVIIIPPETNTTHGEYMIRDRFLCQNHKLSQL